MRDNDSFVLALLITAGVAVLVGLGCLLLAGCTPYEPESVSSLGRHPGPFRTQTKLILYDGPPPAALQAAVTEWNETTGLPLFRFAGEVREEELSITYRITNRLSAPEAEGSWDAYAQLFYSGDCLIETLHGHAESVGIWTHELGHCLGLGHDPDNPDSIMYPSVEGDRQTIPDETVDLLRRYWRSDDAREESETDPTLDTSED